MISFKPIGLITSDLHLSESQEEEYRFELFDWIIKKYARKVSFIFILGDLTDRKNYHSDRLVHKTVDKIHQLTRRFHVLILRGNHDYDADPNIPFFEFLDKMPGVEYFTNPSIWLGRSDWQCKVLLLPHSREPGKDWNLKKHKDLDAVCVHQTFNKARAENGFRLPGLSTAPFRRLDCPVFSGDIHVPQRLGPITYVGAPYHVRYGDQFTPRILLVDKKFNTRSVHFPAPKKFALDLKSAEELKDWKNKISPGDRAKIRLHLPIENIGDWPFERDKIREIAEGMGLVLDNIVGKELPTERQKLQELPKRRSRKEVFGAYCKANQLKGGIVEAGETLLED